MAVAVAVAAVEETASAIDSIIADLVDVVVGQGLLPSEAVDRSLDALLREMEPEVVRRFVRVGLIRDVQAALTMRNGVLTLNAEPRKVRSGRFRLNGRGSGRGSRLHREFTALQKRLKTADGHERAILDFTLDDLLFQRARLAMEISGAQRVQTAVNRSIELCQAQGVKRVRDLDKAALQELNGKFGRES